VLVDYNDSNKMMRIKRDEESIVVAPTGEFANYFYQK